jgi:two-component system, OmpR family, alkaline phosphatase synthesis response regulator PhoP
MEAVMEKIKTESILIIEDDRDIAELIRLNLSEQGYRAEVCHNGLAGLERALEENWSLIVLDIMLPGMDGFEVCKSIRSSNRSMPVLMLTAKSDELDKVLGLELGADGYMTKPFGIRELLARVKSIFRRIEVDREQNSTKTYRELRFGDLQIFPEKRKVLLRNVPLELTTKEFELLLLFADNPGRAYSRQELLDVVWGYHYGGYSHTVNSHINRIRNKIEDDSSEPRYIKTVWGLGYRFAEKGELAL